MSTAYDAELSAMLMEQAQRLFKQVVSPQELISADQGMWPAQLWQQIEQSGFADALVAQDQGGSGLLARDALRLARLAAYHALPLPLGETMLARALWAHAGGAVDAHANQPLSLALASSGDAPRLRVHTSGTAPSFVLSGSAPRVPWARQVGTVLVFARDAHGAGHFVLVPTTGLRTEARLNLANEARDTVYFDDLAVSAQSVRPATGQAAAAGFAHHGALLRAHQMVGAMERCLDFALAYANDRVQFGRAIARFPAVQTMLVQAASQSAAAAACAELAAEHWESALGLGQHEAFEMTVAMAKARSGEAAGQVAALCHQVHAAIGFTQEHQLHYFTRRLWSWRDEFGSDAYWQQDIGNKVCAMGGAALWPMLTHL